MWEWMIVGVKDIIVAEVIIIMSSIKWYLKNKN